MGAVAAPGENSRNHFNKDSVYSGQNVVDCSGSGRFIEKPVLKRVKLPDEDIFQDDTKNGTLTRSQDSWIRND
jgi:hypothetical protein